MNKFLNDVGLKSLLEKIDTRFQTKKDTLINAGLKITQLEPIDGILYVGEGEDEKYLYQGKYYYCNNPVNEVHFNKYKSVDSDIMGETMIYLMTSKDYPNQSIKTSDNDATWFWNNGSILKPNSNVLLSICYNQDESDPIFIVDSKVFTKPGQEEQVFENYVKITYEWESNKKFSALSSKWLDKNVKCKIYYSKTGQGAELIGRNDALELIMLGTEPIERPYIIIEFEQDIIDLGEILFDIDFYNFEIKLSDPVKKISNLTGSFECGKSLASNQIDLSTLNDTNCIVENLNRLCYNRICSNIKFPTGDIKITSVDSMLRNNSIFSNGGGQLDGLCMKYCINFSNMLAGTMISDTSFLVDNINWRLERDIDTLQCTNMFGNCSSLNDITNIYKWLNVQTQHVTREINLYGLFAGCARLENACPKNDDGTDLLLENLDGKVVLLEYMFSNCINLVDYPIFTILNAEAIYMIGMFSNIKNHTNGKTKKFDNFKKWIIKASNRSSVAVFDDMFKGTDFSSFDLKEIICFGDNGSIDLSIIDKGYWRFKQMFMDTYNEKPYKINLHIKTDDKSNHPDGTLEHFVDLVDGIFDEHNMNNGGVYGIYSTSTNPSLLYNYLEEQYKDTEYFNNGSIKTIK